MKAQIVFTGTYKSFRLKRILYNYVLVSGNIESYVADKENEGFLALLEDRIINNIAPKPEYIGLPRYVSAKDLGNTNTIIRIPRKDGSIFWGPE